MRGRQLWTAPFARTGGRIDARRLLFDSGLQVCAGLGKLILGPRLRVFGLVAVLALLRSWHAGCQGRSSNGNRQDCRERIPHVKSPCCSGVTDKKEISRGYGSSNIANL